MLLQKIFGSSFIRYINILETQIEGEIEEAGGKLRKSQQIKNFLLISSYRGLRHKANMPVRGQRTHTNAKTRRKYRIN
jgi:small subunit ribosomal protein S13